MINRWIAVALGAAALAVPGTAVAKGDHAKKDKASEKSHKHGSKHEKKAKAKKPVTFVFKGVYKGAGVVTVAKGNSHVRKGGYVGQDVTFDLATAKLVVADTDGVPGITVADVQAGDLVLVQARLPRGTKAPVAEETAPTATESTDEAVTEEAPAAAEAIKARKLVDKTHPPVKSEEDEDKDEVAAAPTA
jgi:hypothetical protein